VRVRLLGRPPHRPFFSAQITMKITVPDIDAALQIPKTREEAIQVFIDTWKNVPHHVAKRIVVSMTGIYDCYIGLGKSHMEAYAAALRASAIKS
jgi:hypothetical protein